jgi:hypothetical protein
VKTRRFRLTSKVNGLPCAEWWDQTKKRRIMFPQWRKLAEYRRCVRASPLAPAERAACNRILARWFWKDRRQYVKDVVIAADQVLDNLFTPRQLGEPGNSY